MLKKKFIPSLLADSPSLSNPEEDFEWAADYEDVFLGHDYMFLSRAFKMEYIPLDDIVWCYKRLERASFGIFSGLFPFFACYLVIVVGGERKKIRFESEYALDELLAELRKQRNITIGYNPKLDNWFFRR